MNNEPIAQGIQPFVSTYSTPRILPPKGVHPRLLMTPNTLTRIKKDLYHPDHAVAYESFMKRVEEPFAIDGTFVFDAKLLEVVRAKAAAYPLLDSEGRGREAIDLILQILRNFYISPRGDICRAYGAIMYAAACVYDWTYQLLSPDEREEIVFLCQSQLGPYFEVGFPPSKQGMVTGHGSESQIFRDWLSLGIAVYDEYPDIYLFVAGRIQDHAVPARNFYFRSGSHWQGSSYGPVRYRCDLTFETLIHCMTDGKKHFCDDVMKEAAITFACNIRADGEPFREGDDAAENGKEYASSGYYSNAFLASALYRDPLLRDYALSAGRAPLPAVALDFLLLDDPAVGRLDYRTHMPRVRYCGSPRGQYVAHHPSGASVYFKVGEAFSANHEWKDCGVFMIYYKGSLASAANCYQYTTASGETFNYGSPLDFRYNKQTVSCNCMLVYDPDEEVDPRWGNSGGQLVDTLSNREVGTLEEWMSRPMLNRAKILFHADQADANGYLSYCLLGADLSNAYSDKVTDYRRTSLAVATNDGTRPLAVFIYDRLVTRDPAAEKTWQMHTMGKYEIDGKRAVTRHQKGGCLVLDSLLPTAAVLDAVGNENERFIIRGENLAEACDPKQYPVREDGRGRLTVCPTEPAEVDYFLQAMYVTDNDQPITAKAERIVGDGYDAAALLGTVALFPTSVEGLSSFEIDLGAGATLYATNLMPGTWTDGSNVYEVTDENRCIVTYACGKNTYARIENGNNSR